MSTTHMDLTTKRKTLWRMFRSTEKSNKPDMGKTLSEGGDREMNSLKREKIDFAEFQRKAYGGNFFAGPMSLFNPGFFK